MPARGMLPHCGTPQSPRTLSSTSLEGFSVLLRLRMNSVVRERYTPHVVAIVLSAPPFASDQLHASNHCLCSPPYQRMLRSADHARPTHVNWRHEAYGAGRPPFRMS